MAEAVRKGGRQLASLKPSERRAVVEKLASLLIERQEDLLAANKRDLKEAESTKLSKPLLSRLSLTPAKLEDLATGLRQIAASSEPLLGHVLKRTLVRKMREGGSDVGLYPLPLSPFLRSPRA